ncbi:MAG TPA: UpxY family transcription antiterminator [Candidatus Angelobacter sp.]|nr:UpxY family transcription antiterminator [Candidatus Angelobacter sp.]
MFDHSLTAGLRDPKWFVLFVRCNQEKRIAQRLAEYEIEHFLPCYRSLRQWKDRRVMLEMPLFPGYLFVCLPFMDRARVLTMPNVVSLVGGRNSPAEVSEEEIGWIKLGVEHGNAMPHPSLAAGQQVRIIAGALCGLQGTLLRMQNNTRVVISVESIARSFVVEVDLASIEPITPSLPVYREAG